MSLWQDISDELNQRAPSPPLHPESIWNEALSEKLCNISSKELMGEGNPSEQVAQATRAGLLLWNDDLDTAHEIVQDMHQVIGSYWHAILHRREGDGDNAKYWFARVGQHPIFPLLHQQAAQLWPACKSWAKWSPNAFVDAVTEAVTFGEENHPFGEALRQIQVIEFKLLLQHGLA